jgi:hypothetical protein
VKPQQAAETLRWWSRSWAVPGDTDDAFGAGARALELQAALCEAVLAGYDRQTLIGLRNYYDAAAAQDASRATLAPGTQVEQGWQQVRARDHLIARLLDYALQVLQVMGSLDAEQAEEVEA